MKFGKYIRLLNVETFQLEEFSLATTPAYAILSHVWCPEETEIIYNNYIPPSIGRDGLPQRPNKYDAKLHPSYEKIMRTCQEVKQIREVR